MSSLACDETGLFASSCRVAHVATIQPLGVVSVRWGVDAEAMAGQARQWQVSAALTRRGRGGFLAEGSNFATLHML